MRQLKEMKGITLIALVVTIVVLLILAAVSIKLVLDGGITQKAQEATTKYSESEKNEIDQLKNLENQMNEYTQKNWWEMTAQEKNEIDEADKGIAGRENYGGVTIMELNEPDDVIVIDLIDKGTWYFPLKDSALDVLKEYLPTVEKYKWYHSTSAAILTDLAEYKGESPISVEEFSGEDGIIASPTYLQKIIDSFNK